MNPVTSPVHCVWRQPQIVESFSTAVSLHSHTLHSREGVQQLIPQTLRDILPLQREGQPAIPWQRLFWRPLLTSHQAWEVEAAQIRSLGRKVLVSITDHDTIQASLQLRALRATRHVPISVEWTYPYRETFFHLGVHNLPVEGASAIWDCLLGAAMRGEPAELTDVLADLSRLDTVLVVFNHALWDEKGIGADKHERRVREFLAVHGEWVHAIEWNGLRPWRENLRGARLAAELRMPLVSGGDRHGREPNACLNLTSAETFDDFVREIRTGKSTILLMPSYRESHAHRVIDGVLEVLRDDPNHALGWRSWSQRVFHESEQGCVRSLYELWGDQQPEMLNWLIRLATFLDAGPVHSALRAVLTREKEAA